MNEEIEGWRAAEGALKGVGCTELPETTIRRLRGHVVTPCDDATCPVHGDSVGEPDVEGVALAAKRLPEEET